MTERDHVRHSRWLTGFTTLLVVALLLVITPPQPARAASATFTVSSLGDTGDTNVGDGACVATGGGCTLRAAIEEANELGSTLPGEGHTILFDITGGCATVCTISPNSEFPTIDVPIVIDAYQQPGAFWSTNAIEDGLGSNAVIKIELDGSNAGNADGLGLGGGPSRVRGLAIGGFSGNGIFLSIGANGTTIEGNFIGTDASGTVVRANEGHGVRLSDAGAVLIGGVEPGTGNVISGNDSSGILIFGASGNNNEIQGNLIGTDATGIVPLGNLSSGVHIQGGSNNEVGGPRPGDRNVISGNDPFGVSIDGNGASENIVQGNLIGTDVTGTADLGNNFSGVDIRAVADNTIGGTEAGAGNVISGNDDNGVTFRSAGATRNIIQGNLIGTDVAGTGSLGNLSFGIGIRDGAAGNTIGVTFAGTPGNTIAFNDVDGVRVAGATSIGNAIRGNSIHSNGGKGIETATGGNTELTPPVITSAGSAAGTACANCHIEVFSDMADEGSVYHGSVDADGSGNWSFAGVVSGPNITATATDAAGNTSEFSAPAATAGQCPPGSFSATGSTPCTPAPAGWYVPGGGATSATPCAAGTFSAGAGAIACTPAPAGSYVPSNGAIAATPCAAGSFSASAGAIACTPAPIDTYVPSAGATAATPCPAGTTTNGQVGQSACTPIAILRDLTVNLAGSASASGTVTSAPAGISCGVDCSESFPDGTVVTLTASLSGPGAASTTFAGFGGDADCTDGTVTMTANLACTATFNVTTQTVNAATGAGPVGFTTSAGSLASLASVAESSLPAAGKPAGVTFPFGFFSWTVNGLATGQTVVMTMTYPTPVAAGSPFWKVIGSTWTDASALIGSNDGDAVLTLTITDGGFGDADGTANGSIADPGGFGVTAPPTAGPKLTVTKSGNGTGSVTSTPAGIDCGTDCAESYAVGTVVALKAVAAPGSTFIAFTGSWDCLDGRVTMSVDRTCAAVFVQVKLTIKKAGNGMGAVTSTPAGIDCGTDCTESYALGTVVSLRPIAAPGSMFAGWSGGRDCANGRVTMLWNTTCTATFRLTSQ